MIGKLKDPVSGFTHMAGAILSILGLIILVVYAPLYATVWHVVAFAIFGASLVLLYTASTLYHLLPLSDKGNLVLRKIDHMMIFVLIAGTYTPICLVPLRGVWGWTMFGIIWGVTIIGILMKAFWFNVPRWLYTSIYIIMGWMITIAFFPLVKTIPLGGFYWLVAGGLFYSIGGVIYAFKWPKITSKYFGFHEIFHIFVLFGSLCTFWLMFRYILYI